MRAVVLHDPSVYKEINDDCIVYHDDVDKFKENADKSQTNSRQIADSAKPDTKQTQTRHKADTKQTQSRHQVDTKQTPSRHEADTKQTRVSTSTRHEPDTNQAQTETRTRHEPDTNQTQEEVYRELYTLTGLQKILLIEIVRLCNERHSSNTGKVSSKHFQNILIAEQYSANSVKTCLYRLMGKGIITRLDFKMGVNAYSVYAVTEVVKNSWRAILESDTNQTQTRHKLKHEPDTNQTRVSTSTRHEPDTTPSPINNNNIYKLIIKSEELKKYGISDLDIKRILDKDVEPNILKRSFDEFDFDIQTNGIKPTEGSTHKQMFVGIMMNKGCYSTRGKQSYTTLKERSRAAGLKVAKDYYNRLQSMQDEILEVKLKTWLLQTSPEEIENIIPADARKFKGSREAAIRSYFIENIFKGGC